MEQRQRLLQRGARRQAVAAGGSWHTGGVGPSLPGGRRPAHHGAGATFRPRGRVLGRVPRPGRPPTLCRTASRRTLPAAAAAPAPSGACGILSLHLAAHRNPASGHSCRGGPGRSLEARAGKEDARSWKVIRTLYRAPELATYGRQEKHFDPPMWRPPAGKLWHLCPGAPFHLHCTLHFMLPYASPPSTQATHMDSLAAAPCSRSDPLVFLIRVGGCKLAWRSKAESRKPEERLAVPAQGESSVKVDTRAMNKHCWI